MKQSAVKGLTTEQESIILSSLKEFTSWLLKRKIITNVPVIFLEDLPFANEDWVMKYDPKTGGVSFNTYVCTICSFEYFTSIVLHEFFHLAVQKVPNKDDATKIKDDFGGELMKLIDIEADFYTALFYKEIWDYDLIKFLKLFHEGSEVFRDKWIRVVKLERYIGSILSISKMFIDFPKKKKPDVFDLYLVSINPFFTEDSLHVLVVRKEHIYFDLIKASMSDFIKIKDCYTNEDGISLKAYVNKIVSFACKAFEIEVPESLQNEIKNLK